MTAKPEEHFLDVMLQLQADFVGFFQFHVY